MKEGRDLGHEKKDERVRIIVTYMVLISYRSICFEVATLLSDLFKRRLACRSSRHCAARKSVQCVPLENP